MQRSEVEIMAPVGSYESLMAAIQGGANSIYFGISKLNMRSRSSNNFTEEDLEKIVSICNENNVKTYLTVNTILYNKDLPLMREVIDAAKRNNVTAIIASDQAAINYANSIGVEVHISTQLNVSNIETLKFYSKFADVIVLARELNLNNVADITQLIEKEQIKGPNGELIRIEMFAHGALCMAVSGKCYLSLHEMNASANRGACMQMCRKGYEVTDLEKGEKLHIDNEYIMSPKDLCTIGFINKMLDAGVKVFKIEGRARSAEYVKTVVETYNQAIDSYFDGTYNQDKIDEWMKTLSTVFNRGFWDGYYLGKKLGEWSHVYGSSATKKKIYIGKGMNYFDKLKVAEFLVESGDIKIGDEILITGPTTGVIKTTIKEIRVELKKTDIANKGDRFSAPINEIVRRSDKLYKIVDNEDIKVIY